jgi:hypothetical protein
MNVYHINEYEKTLRTSYETLNTSHSDHLIVDIYIKENSISDLKLL